MKRGCVVWLTDCSSLSRNPTHSSPRATRTSRWSLKSHRIHPFVSPASFSQPLFYDWAFQYVLRVLRAMCSNHICKFWRVSQEVVGEHLSEDYQGPALHVDIFSFRQSYYPTTALHFPGFISPCSCFWKRSPAVFVSSRLCLQVLDF